MSKDNQLHLRYNHKEQTQCCTRQLLPSLRFHFQNWFCRSPFPWNFTICETSARLSARSSTARWLSARCNEWRMYARTRSLFITDHCWFIYRIARRGVSLPVAINTERAFSRGEVSRANGKRRDKTSKATGTRSSLEIRKTCFQSTHVSGKISFARSSPRKKQGKNLIGLKTFSVPRLSRVVPIARSVHELRYNVIFSLRREIKGGRR